MHYIVYKTTNLVNGKEYIGIHQTKDLNDGYLGSGKHLKYAIAKYGAENFSREVLFSYDNEQDMLAKEAEIVTEEWCSWSNTYNICVGGFGGGWKYCNSLPNKKEWSIRGGVTTGKITSHRSKTDPEFQATLKRQGRRTFQKLHVLGKAGNGMLGRKHTNETKSKMSKSKNRGSTNSQFGTMWITNGKENRKTVDVIPEGWYRGRTTKTLIFP